ncbi:MAG: hypothetical protein ACOX4U_07700 [Anaerovoracaceae bacterium]|jgi:hypothetical protein
MLYLKEGFILFIIAVALIIMVSIQLTLNKILRILNELKSYKR